ncbi:MAG: flagellar hook-associated protein FlgK, partial [Gammaproteobacteria bacterium]|nr:flagellar hook-associated protein FlgK [Gammaproteobacteria bacterium]
MSMISSGLSGLAAAQRGLETTSNNVANAGTDGYVRRRIVQAEAITANTGLRSDIGSGVRVTGVERLYDQFLAETLRGSVSTEQRAQTLTEMTGRLDSLLGSPELGIGRSIQSFYDQVDVLSRDTTSIAGRQQLLMQGESLSQRFQQLSAQLDLLNNEVDRRMGDSASRINTIAASLARINETLGRGTASSNDLLDQRDALLSQLSEQVDATVIRNEDGTVSVTIGNGQALVLGTQSGELSLGPDPFDPTSPQLSISFGSTSLAVSRQIAGGALGGLLAFKSGALGTAQRDLDYLAAGVTNAFNQQHRLGADGNGVLGGDFFTASTPEVAPAANNAGSASMSAAVADATALRARDYELRYDGSAWQLFDATSQAPLGLTGTGTAGDPFVFDGLAVTVSAGAAANDRFRIRPVAEAARDISVALADPAAIAAAAPVRVGRALGNLSAATIGFAGVANIAAPSLQQPVEIRFESANTFRIYDSGNNDLSGPLAYTSGADINFSGWIARIT